MSKRPSDNKTKQSSSDLKEHVMEVYIPEVLNGVRPAKEPDSVTAVAAGSIIVELKSALKTTEKQQKGWEKAHKDRAKQQRDEKTKREEQWKQMARECVKNSPHKSTSSIAKHIQDRSGLNPITKERYAISGISRVIASVVREEIRNLGTNG